MNVLGTQTITESNIVRIADKNIELAYVVSRQFVATAVTGTADITAINPTAGLIPGMVVTTSTAGFTIPPNTEIVSITNNVATLSNNITGSGQITLTAIGPSDTTAVDGGMIVKGTTDKKITWKGTDGGVTYNTWVSSENFDLASGKHLSLNAIKVADPNTLTIGPNAGGATGQIDLAGGSTGYTLGSAVVGSGATSFNFTGVGEVKLPAGATNQRNTNALVGMIRYNTQTNEFEGYSGSTPAWGSLGGSADLSAVAENILPDADATRDLGSSSKRWANIYSADLQLSNEGGANDVDGTWGQYTIQEGEDDLFLINRRSGKKYKFMLQEVN